MSRTKIVVSLKFAGTQAQGDATVYDTSGGGLVVDVTLKGGAQLTGLTDERGGKMQAPRPTSTVSPTIARTARIGAYEAGTYTNRRAKARLFVSSRGWTRTSDTRINSPLLYRLSYAGMTGSGIS